jgi:hypothetical protein
MYFDLTVSGAVEVELWGLELIGNIIVEKSMKGIVKEISLITGRMLAPPEWSQLVRKNGFLNSSFLMLT